jgi:hypothetical protein
MLEEALITVQVTGTPDTDITIEATKTRYFKA